MKVIDTGKYRLLPDPTPDEYDALKASIREYGVRSPVIVDETGELLDGRQRLAVCAELKITDYPVTVEANLSDEQKRHLVLTMGCTRRTLTNDQKKELVKAELLRSPDISNAWLASICGVRDITVEAVRKELEATSQIERFDKLRGKDGKTRKRHLAVSVPSVRRLGSAIRAVADLGKDDAPNGTLPEHRVKRLAAQKRFAERENRPLINALPVDDADRYRLFNCDFRRLGKTAGIQPGTVDLIVADPPYFKDDLHLYSKVAKWAKKFLKDGGVMVVYCGTMYLPEILDRLRLYLRHHWQCGVLLDEEKKRPMHGYNVTQCWRPVAVMTKGKYTSEFNLKDMINGGGREKELHPWQQDLESVTYYVRELSAPGALVVDPFGGSFTVAAACKTLGNRSYIGCDIERKWVDVGIDRLARMTSQEEEEEEDWGLKDTDDEDWGAVRDWLTTPQIAYRPEDLQPLQGT